MARKSGSRSQSASRFGVGEWYGHVVSAVAPARRAQLAAEASKVKTTMPCPFKQSAHGDNLCTKKGGVCSLIPYVRDDGGEVITSGSFVTVCPNRFWQDGAVFRWVAQTVLGIEKPLLVKEVQFLESTLTQPDEVAREEDPADSPAAVGRIDSVLIDENNAKQWCALELQAVYFSGKGMGSHLKQFLNDQNGLPWPDHNRRPDWRSSGPKRLMPQLMTKIPTLRRWGKRMTVVIDKGFYESMGEMREAEHLSNSDIVWFVVDYEPSIGGIKLLKVIATTLEDSIEALTAGKPLSLEEFEEKLSQIVHSPQLSMKKKVVRMM